MDYLTVTEVAELKGCTPQYIQKIAKDGKLPAKQQLNPQNKKPQYLVPITALPDELQAKHYRQKKLDSGVAPELKTPIKQQKNTVKKAFEEYSEAERQEITFWCQLLQEWQDIRASHKSKTQVDPKFVAKCQLEYPDISISVDILYRKYAAYKDNDYDGLVDKRGGWNKGTSSIPDKTWDAFLWYYLDENKLTVSRCYELTRDWTAEFYPELINAIPSERSFRRHIQSDMSKAVVTYAREGDKACNDRCLPYVTRLYDKLQANDVWIADNHTFDIQSVNSDGQLHRLHLTAFLDAKSGVIVGWNITDNPCSQSTVLALRHGIMRFGLPKMVYFDNGSEFLTHDVGGRGHRTRKNAPETPPTILQHLGIEMRNALVRNAKAKPIERTFYTVKQHFSRSWNGFCGGTIMERPESLKRRIKDGNVPMDFEIRQHLDVWIDGDYNMQAYGGSETQYKNMSRIDVWNTSIQSVGVRMAAESELNLMLMRSTRYQKVKRNGVYVDMYGEKLWYMNPEETYKYLDDEVYVRYDPAELTSVRLYDKDDKYLCTWALADKLMVDYITDSKDEISDAMALQHRVKRMIKQDKNELTAGLSNEQRLTQLDAMVRRAHRNIDGFEIKLPSKIIPIISNEEPRELLAAAGAESVEINLSKMSSNAEKRKE